jgi:hypothetical protein
LQKVVNEIPHDIVEMGEVKFCVQFLAMMLLFLIQMESRVDIVDWQTYASRGSGLLGYYAGEHQTHGTGRVTPYCQETHSRAPSPESFRLPKSVQQKVFLL